MLALSNMRRQSSVDQFSVTPVKRPVTGQALACRVVVACPHAPRAPLRLSRYVNRCALQLARAPDAQGAKFNGLDGRARRAVEEALGRGLEREPDRRSARQRHPQCRDRQGAPARAFRPRHHLAHEEPSPASAHGLQAHGEDPFLADRQSRLPRALSRRPRLTSRPSRRSSSRSPSAKPSRRWSSAAAAGRSATRRWPTSTSAARTRSPACPTASSTPAVPSSRRRRAAASANSSKSRARSTLAIPRKETA